MKGKGKKRKKSEKKIKKLYQARSKFLVSSVLVFVLVWRKYSTEDRHCIPFSNNLLLYKIAKKC